MFLDFHCPVVPGMIEDNYRVLVVDDNPRIHDDFRKIFRKSKKGDGFDALKDELFGRDETSESVTGRTYSLDCFINGELALNATLESVQVENPYAVAFVDMRMPQWDGIETTLRLWEADPDIQVVICTAYMDHTWESINKKLGEEHSFLILKKPFEVIEVKQLAQMLSSKWEVMRKERKTMMDLEAALKAKDIFMARVSHELRTPLHGIIGVIDLLKETRLDVQQLDFLQTLNSCGENLDRIIDDILDYSALEDGRFNLEESDFNLLDFFETIRKQFRFETVTRGLDLVVNLDDKLPEWIYGDSTRLHQIVGNLLRNAFKYTEDGEVTLTVNLDGEEQGKMKLDIEVSDTGVGIAPDYMNSLFMPFSQAENVNRRRFGGNGLGLAICKAIIESMGGTIGVESELGEGTVVRFSLLLQKCKEKDPAVRVLGSEAMEDNNGARKSPTALRVLAVDDSRTNRKVIKNQLFWMGHECHVVGSCQEAIESLGTRNFDLIFMDCQMPDIDGFETTVKIRTLFPECRDIPIIALTANIDRSTQEHCELVGMDGFVSKPARRADLEKKIVELIPV